MPFDLSDQLRMGMVLEVILSPIDDNPGTAQRQFYIGKLRHMIYESRGGSKCILNRMMDEFQNHRYIFYSI